jgi:hypothetical protein
MDDQLKIWTTVGSAGTLSQIDLAKVNLYQSVIQLGTEVVLPTPISTQTAQAPETPRFGPTPTIQAVVRYNVTPVEGLFFIANNFRYHLQIRFRGQITAKLMEADLATGTETQLILLDSNSFPPAPGFQVQAAFPSADSPLLDFVNKGYYVEATLVAPAIVVGHPAAISIIKLFASPNFPG